MVFKTESKKLSFVKCLSSIFSEKNFVKFTFNFTFVNAEITNNEFILQTSPPPPPSTPKKKA